MTDLTWDVFHSDFMPSILTDWGVDSARAAEIGKDCAERATAFAASDTSTRQVLRAAVAEEVFRYEPREASLSVLAAVNIVVRNSLLEEAHTQGHVEASGVKGITELAAGALIQWLNEHYDDSATGPAGVFSSLDESYPNAWAGLGALYWSLNGGRTGFPVRRDVVSELPSADEIVDLDHNENGHVVLSGIEPRFDQSLMRVLRAAEPRFTFYTPSLSRISRDISKTLRVIEYLLQRGASVMTTNYLIRPGEAFCRGGGLEVADSKTPGVSAPSRGLSGAHLKTYTRVQAKQAAAVDSMRAQAGSTEP